MGSTRYILHRHERDPRGPKPRGDGVGSVSRVMGCMGALSVAVHNGHRGDLGGDR
jgi:hypothetical protein